MSLYEKFNKEIKPELKKELGKKNINEVPKLDKIVVSMGIWSLVTRKWVKDFSDLEENLKVITGQKPHIIKARKSVSNFKLREGMPVMLRVTIRGKRAYDFIDRLVKYVLPRVRDFRGVSPKKFDGKGNLNIGLKSQMVFPELTPDDIKTPQGIQVTIATTSAVDEEAQKLLEKLWIIFLQTK